VIFHGLPEQTNVPYAVRLKTCHRDEANLWPQSTIVLLRKTKSKLAYQPALSVLSFADAQRARAQLVRGAQESRGRSARDCSPGATMSVFLPAGGFRCRAPASVSGQVGSYASRDGSHTREPDRCCWTENAIHVHRKNCRAQPEWNEAAEGTGGNT